MGLLEKSGHMYSRDSYDFISNKLKQDTFECLFKGAQYKYEHYIDDEGYVHMNMTCNDDVACKIKVPQGSHLVEIFLATYPFGETYWDIEEQIIWIS